MGYEVNIKPGKRIGIEPKDLNQKLKDGCEQVIVLGSNIYVCGRHGCGKTSVLRYIISILPERLNITIDEILYFHADEFVDAIIENIRENLLGNIQNNIDEAFFNIKSA